MMPILKRWAVLLCAAVGLTSMLTACGGGEQAQTAAVQAVPAKVLLPTMKRLSASSALQASTATPYGTAEAADAVKQLLDFAETNYKSHFPSHQSTKTFERYIYRYYPETRKYVGVAVNVLAGDGLVEGGVYVKGGDFGEVPVYVGRLNEFITPFAVLHYTDKVYALWTDKYPFAVTKSGAVRVKNMTQWNGLHIDLFLCFIANHPLQNGEILTLCKDSPGLKWHLLYIDPTKEEMHEYTGSVPSDLSYTVDPDGGIPAETLGKSWLDVDKPTPEHPLWNSFARVADGYYITEIGSSGGLLKFIGDDRAVSVIADKDPNINGIGTIQVMSSYTTPDDSWWPPSFVPMGTKVYLDSAKAPAGALVNATFPGQTQSGLLPAECKFTGDACWKEAVRNGTIMFISTTATDQTKRQTVWGIYKTLSSIALSGGYTMLYCGKPFYADNGTLFAPNDPVGNRCSWFEEVYFVGNTLGGVYQERDLDSGVSACYQKQFNLSLLGWTTTEANCQ